MNPFFGLSEDKLKELQIVEWGYTEELLAQSFDKYHHWTELEHNRSLNYLLDQRKDIRKSLSELYSGAKSAAVFLFSYAPTRKVMMSEEKNKIASYTVGFEGLDYHHVIRDRLEEILGHVKIEIPNIEAIFSVDVEPVLERDLAYRAGLGWFGKNSMLINQKEGSYFIIASIIFNQGLNIELPSLDIDHCGSCTACIEACPTDAIDGNLRTIKLNQCLSTFTIEMFKEDNPPTELRPTDLIFGCDICQDVCPWNKKKLSLTSFIELPKRAQDIIDFWHRPLKSLYENVSKFTNKTYLHFWHRTSFERSGKKGILKNLKWRLTQKSTNKTQNM